MSTSRPHQSTRVEHGSLEASRNPPAKLMRSCVACRRCHAQKVKCNGEQPCRNCRGSKTPVECVYPVRDRRVTISESYIRKLEAELSAAKRKASPEQSSEAEALAERQPKAPSYTRHSHKRFRAAAVDAPSPPGDDGLVESPAEPFLDEMNIQPTYIGEAACTTFGSKFRQFLLGGCTPPPVQRPKYYKNIKLLRASCTECELPNRSDAQLLVRVVLRFVGADYHLLRRRSFLERLDETYKLPVLDDPIWLCRVFTVLALGEVYSVRSSRLHGDGVPGTAFFVKAIEFFQDLYEEPTLEYIETLTLLSFYSVILNRRNTAYTYTGLALRLSVMLGLHRKVEADSTITAADREHRIRVWWTVYCLDRLMSSKVGLPAMIQDEDIDTQLPSMDGLSAQDMQDFYDPAHLVAQIHLSRITGNVLSKIYHIPQPGRANTFIQGVQKTLTSLRTFHENLPALLRLSQSNPVMYANRSVASLHLHFNQCVILTTRPVLFYTFRSKFQNFTHGMSEISPSVPPITLALAEACIQAARVSNRILSQLWVDGCLAVYGFYDAVSIFSSTLVLMISSAMQNPETDIDADGIGTAWSVIRSMREEGNVPASEYFDQLVHLKQDLEEACARRRRYKPQQASSSSGPVPSPQQLTAAPSNKPPNLHDLAHAASHMSIPQAVPPTTETAGATDNVLQDPTLSDFLAEPLANWDPSVFDQILTGTSGDQSFWNFDWGKANLV
ncbi:hypothetical protein BP5796_06112 [Coleophoma crateriformis]|uniref:Zn(2)-C6 fungal-type domain-containing protein n=1 Tax=Coleophoma crateriformis TaxID=565419 RepID=A0A3D8RWF6_9HELO|nr:hypothetical protein BP5796_06112 [Coleophoma crateriformis]